MRNWRKKGKLWLVENELRGKKKEKCWKNRNKWENTRESWFFPHFSGQRLFWLEIDLQKMLTASPLISWVLEKFQGFLAFLDFLAKYCVNIWRTIGSFGVGTICNHIQHINKSDARTCNPWCAHDMLMKLSGAPCGTILWQLHFKLMMVSVSFPLA